MNTTLNVASFYNCDQLYYYEKSVDVNNPIWRQTIKGCKMLDFLKDMYQFNVSYVTENTETNVTVVGDTRKLHQQNDFIDFYLRPTSIGMNKLEYMSPFHPADMWSLGFILRHPDHGNYVTFYSKPFSRPAWNCLYGMAFFVSILFYLLKRWEMVTVGGRECSYAYEALMVIGAYCQHIPPIEAKTLSRRIAYFVFLIFAYLIYTYYSSNLLSHLVNDKKHGITLRDLPKIDLKIAIVDYMRFNGAGNINTFKSNNNSLINRIRKIKSVSVTEGLEEVKAGKMALLSDYISLYPRIKKSFTSEEVCGISTIDVIRKIKKYFFTSKTFKYKEQFKIGALRAKESGIFNRLMSSEYEIPKCEKTYLVQTMFTQILLPISILFVTYIICISIMLLERVHYKRNRVLPFID